MNHEPGVRPAGYRLPDATRPGPVRLQVSDMERSLAFYHELIGFRIIARKGARALLGAAGSDAALLELSATATSNVRRGRLGLYHFAVLLPDRPALGSFLAHALRHGARPGAADHLVSEALYLQDPDDLGIEIYRDRPREEWGRRGAEIAMASDPLDGDGILAAGAGREWSGLPERTTIGHVHLHVGSIQAARAFYHGALGLDVVVSSYPGALFMSAGGYHHHLGVNTWAGTGAAAPAAGEPRLLEWTLVLPAPADVDAALESLGRAGHSTDTGGAVADPWGTRLHLVGPVFDLDF